MTTVPFYSEVTSTETWPTLRHMISRLASNYLPVARNNKSYFVNDVPDEVYIDTDPELVATVLNGMLSAVVANASQSCIRVSAKLYGNVILIHVKDYNNLNYCSVENGLQQLQPFAEKVGGHVSVTSQRHNVATFAFGFPNLPLAA